MKIAINTGNSELFNAYNKAYKKLGYETVNVRSESTLFDNIRNGEVGAFILENDVSFLKKAVDLIKKINPYTPIIIVLRNPITTSQLLNSDVYMPSSDSFNDMIFLTLHNILTYINAFGILKKLVNKPKDKIKFGTFMYDPMLRILYNNTIEIKKFSIKEGGILEILALNYKDLVKKEVILEKVWQKSDYFAGRSCDVYVTYLRNSFKQNLLDLRIKNISGVGLILE